MKRRDFLGIGAAATAAMTLPVRPAPGNADPAGNNVTHAKRLAIPSAWADRTGTVYCGDGYMMNPGSAGIVDASGKVIAHSQVGAEVIAVGEIQIKPSQSR